MFARGRRFQGPILDIGLLEKTRARTAYFRRNPSPETPSPDRTTESQSTLKRWEHRPSSDFDETASNRRSLFGGVPRVSPQLLRAHGRSVGPECVLRVGAFSRDTRFLRGRALCASRRPRAHPKFGPLPSVLAYGRTRDPIDVVADAAPQGRKPPVELRPQHVRGQLAEVR